MATMGDGRKKGSQKVILASAFRTQLLSENVYLQWYQLTPLGAFLWDYSTAE